MDSTKSNKIIGYILLLVGLLLIIWPLWQSYAIFTGQSLPPDVFKTQQQGTQAGQQNSFDLQKQVQTALLKILPIDKLLDLTSWMILAWVLILGGGQIAGIGIKMLK